MILLINLILPMDGNFFRHIHHQHIQFIYLIWLLKHFLTVKSSTSSSRNKLFLGSFSSQPIWWHYVIITVPKILQQPNNALVILRNGTVNDPWDYSIFIIIILMKVSLYISAPTESSTIELALATGTVTAEVKQILNQPILFSVCIET